MGLYNRSVMVAILDTQIRKFSNLNRTIHQRGFRKKTENQMNIDDWRALNVDLE